MEPPPPPSLALPSRASPSPSPTQSKQPTFSQLEVLDPSKPHKFLHPVKRINNGPDVAHFLTSKAYRDLGVFLLQLNRALCPRVIVDAGAESRDHKDNITTTKTGGRANSSNVQTFPLSASRAYPPSVTRLQQLLARLEEMIEEAPPDTGPRRFGNISFRRWYALLEERVDDLLGECVAPGVLRFGWHRRQSEEGSEQQTLASDDGGVEAEEHPGARWTSKVPPLLADELKAYFLGGFGSAQRLDYGTGHELSFFAFLGCLWKLGAFLDGAGESEPGDMERNIVLGVIEPYLKVIRRLILTYTLEPAGSHGVWGLDDHSFLPYIFGSAQLTRPIADAASEPMPQEGSVARAPRPSDVTKAAAVERLRGENMYFSAIGFINDVKKGPFWEHSPILFDISGIRDGWGKINKGMVKMFDAEVLAKFPVVQHFPFGSLFSWETDPAATAPAQTVHMANQPATSTATTTTTTTAAPWAQAGSGISYSRVPPVSSGGSNAPSAMPRRVAGGPPHTGPLPPTTFPRGTPGTTSNQFAVTKAPWARD